MSKTNNITNVEAMRITAASQHTQALAYLRQCASLVDDVQHDLSQQTAVLRCQWIFARAQLKIVAEYGKLKPDFSDTLVEGIAMLRTISNTYKAAPLEAFNAGVYIYEMDEFRQLAKKYLKLEISSFDDEEI